MTYTYSSTSTETPIPSAREVACACGRFRVTVSPYGDDVKLWCKDCMPPHEGGWLAAVDEWGHRRLSLRWHQALLWWACDARELRFGTPWRFVARERAGKWCALVPTKANGGW